MGHAKRGCCHLVFSLFIPALPAAIVLAAEIKPWQTEWEETLKAADKEGQVVIYGGEPFARYFSIVEAFQKAYPKIRGNLIGGRGSQLGPRIIAERRAGKYLADFFVGGKGTALATLHAGKILDPIRPLLVLPEVVDPSKWWQGRHQYLDPEGQYIFVFVGNPSSVEINYNLKLVNPKEFRSYWDLLQPKWKGKMTALDPRVRGADTPLLFFYYTSTLGPEFMRRLFGEMEMTYSRDYRQPVDWLGRGKFAICLPCAQTEVGDAIDQGLPIGQIGMLEEGGTLTSGGHTISLMNRAPHSHAAKVFVNWLLSREGQSLIQRVKEAPLRSRPNSLRVDIAKDDVPPERHRVEGVPYFDGDDPRFSDRRPADKLLNEILK